MQPEPAEVPRRSHVGTVSLLVAVTGAVLTRAALFSGAAPSARTWIVVIGAGFEAAVVGGLADWFAVTALFRHPLGLPFPHTAIIPNRRNRLIQSIVSTVEHQWLSPEVISRRLERVAPSQWVSTFCAIRGTWPASASRCGTLSGEWRGC